MECAEVRAVAEFVVAEMSHSKVGCFAKQLQILDEVVVEVDLINLTESFLQCADLFLDNIINFI